MKKKLDKGFFIAYLSLEVIDNVKRFTARPTAAVPRASGQPWPPRGPAEPRVPPGAALRAGGEGGGRIRCLCRTPP